MKYTPRTYWADRLDHQGPKYVAYNNRSSSFKQQVGVFQRHMEKLIPKGGSLLDFGCGVGRFAPFGEKWVDRYEGVDIVEEVLCYLCDRNVIYVYFIPLNKKQ